jgi:putative ABC transport system permease protein
VNIFNKITFQCLKKSRTRTAVTIIGVILSVAMIAAVTSFIASLQAYLINSEIAYDGDWHVKFINSDSAFVKKVSEDKDVKTAAVIQNLGYSPLTEGSNPDKPYLFVAGFNDTSFKAIPVRLITGRLPKDGSEILIPEHLENNGGVGYKIGDTLTLSLGSRIVDGEEIGQGISLQSDENGKVREALVPQSTKTYTIVGICARPGFENYSAPGYTLITKADLQLAAAASSFDVFVTLKSPAKVYDFAERNTGKLQNEFNRELLRFYGVSTNDSFNAVLYGLAAILIVIIMIGSVLLIYNSFAISVSERARQFGILSSVGATKKQLRKSVLFEGLCIGAIGIPLGIIAGVGGIGITFKLIGGLFKVLSDSTVVLALKVSVPALLIAAVLGAVTILISAYIPARKAVKKSAIDTIRQTDDVKINPKAVKTSKLISLLFGLEGTLALKNFKRNKKRYRSTVISLFVSVVLFISASAFGMYFKQGTDMTMVDLGYDLSFNASQGSWHLEDEQLLRLYNQMKTADGVYKSAYYNYVNCSSPIPKSEFTKRFLEYYSEMDISEDTVNYYFTIYFIDDGAYRQYLDDLELSSKEYGIKQGKLPAAARVVGYDSDAQRTIAMNVFNKQSVSLDKAGGTHPEPWSTSTQKIGLAISEAMPEGFSQSQFNGLAVFAPYSDMANLGAPKESFNGLSLTFSSHDPMKSAAQMELMIKEAGVVAGYHLYNVAEALEQNRSIILLSNVFTYGFVILISLITIANVFNTVSTGISLRRREFAMLRSIGLGNKSFNKMMSFECLFYGLKALLYGLPVSVAMTFLIYKAMLRGVDVSFNLPWSSVGVAVFSVFFVVFVTMMYSVSKIKKANVIDALRDDAV